MENNDNYPDKFRLVNQISNHLEFLKSSGVEWLPKMDRQPLMNYEIKAKIQVHNDSLTVKEEGFSLDKISSKMADCKLCQLGKTRTNVVFGAGNPNADLIFVGEAPGRDEDLKGDPFVGEAGQLLTRIIEAINLKREDVYICNVVKCRPPENRNPSPDEIEACEPFLIKQIQTIKPKVICALGKFATQTLLKTDTPISQLRGHFQDYQGVPLMPTYHPAFLLRNPDKKREVWNDIKQVRKLINS